MASLAGTRRKWFGPKSQETAGRLVGPAGVRVVRQPLVAPVVAGQKASAGTGKHRSARGTSRVVVGKTVSPPVASPSASREGCWGQRPTVPVPMLGEVLVNRNP